MTSQRSVGTNIATKELLNMHLSMRISDALLMSFEPNRKKIVGKVFRVNLLRK